MEPTINIDHIVDNFPIIAQGQYGKVYLDVDTSSVYKVSQLANQASVDFFEAEVQALVTLRDHAPHVTANIIGSMMEPEGTRNRRGVIHLPYIYGIPLGHWMDDRRTRHPYVPTWNDMSHILTQIHQMHAAGVANCDLHRDNIMVAFDPEQVPDLERIPEGARPTAFYLIDFGHALTKCVGENDYYRFLYSIAGIVNKYPNLSTMMEQLQSMALHLMASDHVVQSIRLTNEERVMPPLTWNPRHGRKMIHKRAIQTQQQDVADTRSLMMNLNDGEFKQVAEQVGEKLLEGYEIDKELLHSLLKKHQVVPSRLMDADAFRRATANHPRKWVNGIRQPEGPRLWEHTMEMIRGFPQEGFGLRTDLNIETFDKRRIRAILRTCAYLHDIGKIVDLSKEHIYKSVAIAQDILRNRASEFGLDLRDIPLVKSLIRYNDRYGLFMLGRIEFETLQEKLDEGYEKIADDYSGLSIEDYRKMLCALFIADASTLHKINQVNRNLYMHIFDNLPRLNFADWDWIKDLKERAIS